MIDKKKVGALTALGAAALLTSCKGPAEIGCVYAGPEMMEKDAIPFGIVAETEIEYPFYYADENESKDSKEENIDIEGVYAGPEYFEQDGE